MGRPRRSAPGGWIYHVLKRANARSIKHLGGHAALGVRAAALQDILEKTFENSVSRYAARK